MTEQQNQNQDQGNGTILNLRSRSVPRPSSIPRLSATENKPRKNSEPGTTAANTVRTSTPEPATEAHELKDPFETELVDNFQKLGCSEEPTQTVQPKQIQAEIREVPDAPPEYTEPIENTVSKPAIEKQPQIATSMYPTEQLRAMTDGHREINFGKTDGCKECADDKKQKPSPHTEERRTMNEAGNKYRYFEYFRQIPQQRTPISDSALIPKPFSGTASEDPEEWLNYFERYTDYRGIRDPEKRNVYARRRRAMVNNTNTTTIIFI